MTPRKKLNNTAAGKPTAKKNTSLPSAVMQDQNDNMMILDLCLKTAEQNNGEVLRYRVQGSQLIILLVDGRKFYIELGV